MSVVVILLYFFLLLGNYRIKNREGGKMFLLIFWFCQKIIIIIVHCNPNMPLYWLQKLVTKKPKLKKEIWITKKHKLTWKHEFKPSLNRKHIIET